MNNLTTFHEMAMDLANQAEAARRNGDAKLSIDLFTQAYEKERDAAALLEANLTAEPTRSVLYRSAASLALDCGEHREAERLIAKGLAGNPPDEIAEELRDLFEMATFRRHLVLRGADLGQGEFQMSLAGSAVGYGIIDGNEYFPRLATVENILIRTAERQQDEPFREHGPPPKVVSDNFAFFVSTARAASFAVSIRVGRPIKQKHLFSDEADIVFEFIECMRLFTEERREQLRDRIGDSAYFRNFVTQARRISPDGSRIRTVGFTAVYNNSERQIALKGRPSDKWLPRQVRQKRTTELVGVLTSAHKDEKRPDRNLIGIRDEFGKTKTIHVPKGLMNDIVRPHWDMHVVAICKASDERYTLIELRPLTSS